VLIDDSLSVLGDECYKLAIRALENDHDCQEAAVYIGALCHCIGDACAYWHLIALTPGHESKIKLNIHDLTCKKISDRLGNSEFFLTYEAEQAFAFYQEKVSASVAIYFAGFDTRYGYSDWPEDYPAYYEDADWLAIFVPSSGNPQLWGEINKDIKYWNNEDWSALSVNGSKYFETLEHNLNTAVFYCAAAMNDLKDKYVNCNCEKKDDRNKDNNLITKWAKYTMLFALIALPSLITTISAMTYIVISQKVDSIILEKISI
jgi:hypothetical protein